MIIKEILEIVNTVDSSEEDILAALFILADRYTQIVTRPIRDVSEIIEAIDVLQVSLAPICSTQGMSEEEYAHTLKLTALCKIIERLETEVDFLEIEGDENIELIGATHIALMEAEQKLYQAQGA